MVYLKNVFIYQYTRHIPILNLIFNCVQPCSDYGFNKLDITKPKDVSQKLQLFVQKVWEVYLKNSTHLNNKYFSIMSRWKRARPFIYANLNSRHLIMLCANFDWNWSSGYGKEVKNVEKKEAHKRSERQTDGRQTKRDQTSYHGLSTQVTLTVRKFWKFKRWS